MYKIILSLSSVLLFGGCTERSKTTDTPQENLPLAAQRSEKDYNTDTLKVEGKVVVFFCPSQQEYDSIPDDPDSGIGEVLADFTYYAGVVGDSMKLSGYETMLTGSRFIEIRLNNGSYQLFDRLATDEHLVGIIFSDGVQEPLIEYGVGTDLDLMSSFRSFDKN